mmetsp:Transcript_49005/g.112375  ORF Transcript_49005/g.112375 Transcript_49005/m.112375 type:complete len:652 (+) Transcript_49005:52-2007(+)
MPPKHTARAALALASVAAALLLVFFHVSTDGPEASLAAEPTRPALGWATAGGGWRAMSVGMSVGRNLHKLGMLSDLTHVAANSGGAWFLTQFSYSQPFFDNVTSTTSMQTIISDWLASHQSIVGELTDDEVTKYMGGQSTTAAVIDKLKKFHAQADELAKNATSQNTTLKYANTVYTAYGLLAAIIRFDGTWTNIVGAILSCTDAKLHGLPAIPANRIAAFGNPAIHIQTCNATSASLALPNASRAVQVYVLDAAGRNLSKTLDVVPMQYVVPGRAQGAGATAGYRVAPGAPHGKSITYAGQSIPSVLGAPFAGGPPNVTVVAATSSAALGTVGSRQMLQRFLKYLGGTGESNSLNTLMEKFGDIAPFVGEDPEAVVLKEVAILQDFDEIVMLLADDAGMAGCNANPGSLPEVMGQLECILGQNSPLAVAELSVCDQPMQEWEGNRQRCAFPAQRLLDGGFVDNLGAAQAVSAMQAEAAKKSDPIRLLLSANGECSEGPDVHAPITPDDQKSGCTLYDLAALFGGAYVKDVIEISWGMRSPSPQIFAKAWKEMKFEYVNGSAPVNGTGVPIGGAYAARFKTVTVANGAFGVAAGTPIDVLVIASLMPVSLLMGFIPPQYPVLAEYANMLADESNLDKLIGDWWNERPSVGA